MSDLTVENIEDIYEREVQYLRSELAAQTARAEAAERERDALRLALQVHRNAMAASLHPMMDGSHHLRIKDLLAKPALAAAAGAAPAADLAALGIEVGIPMRNDDDGAADEPHLYCSHTPGTYCHLDSVSAELPKHVYADGCCEKAESVHPFPAGAGQEGHTVTYTPTEAGWRADCSCGWEMKALGGAVDAMFAARRQADEHLRSVSGAGQEGGES